MNKNWIKQDLEYFKKCETAYRLYMRKINTGSDDRVIERYSNRSERKETQTREKSPPSRKKPEDKITTKRPLNDYQCFIREKSEKYRNYSPKSRMAMIAFDWKKISQSKS
jgi:hypothetical protein